MSRRKENTGFICENCGRKVLPVSNGGYRNHCPFCLFSKHIDIVPGDREEECGGLMKPVGLRYKSGKGFQIVHKCLKCGEERVNKVAESSVQPDDIEELVKLFRLLYLSDRVPKRNAVNLTENESAGLPDILRSIQKGGY